MRIMVVSPYLPHAAVGHGGGQAIRGLLRALLRRHDCLLVSLLRPGEQDRAGEVRRLGCELVTVPYLDRRAAGSDRLRLGARRLRAVTRACRDGYPYYAAKYAERSLAAATIAAATAYEPDVIQIEYLQLAYLLRDLRRWRDGRLDARPERPAAARPRLILDSHELGSLPRRRRARHAGRLRRSAWLREAAAWDRLARDASFWADVTLCVTDQDRSLLAAAGGRGLVTMPLGVELPGIAWSPAADAPARILFLGSFQHPPNRAAAAALCERIWPRICDGLPDWELVLAGPGSDVFLAERTRRAAPRIRALGFVDDLAGLFAGCRLFAAPLFEGGGIKIKILEAMARGLPVVTTPVGVEGIATADDDLAWIAADQDEFAACLLGAARAPAIAVAKAQRARAHIEQRFSWDAIVNRLEAVYRGATPPS